MMDYTIKKLLKDGDVGIAAGAALALIAATKDSEASIQIAAVIGASLIITGAVIGRLALRSSSVRAQSRVDITANSAQSPRAALADESDVLPAANAFDGADAETSFDDETARPEDVGLDVDV